MIAAAYRREAGRGGGSNASKRQHAGDSVRGKSFNPFLGSEGRRTLGAKAALARQRSSHTRLQCASGARPTLHNLCKTRTDGLGLRLRTRQRTRTQQHNLRHTKNDRIGRLVGMRLDLALRSMFPNLAPMDVNAESRAG